MVMFLFAGLGLIYLILMIIAFPHAKEGQAVVAAGPWWCLYKRSYKDDASRICNLGRLVLLFDLALLAYILAR